jgi:hypothetical protein
MSKKLGAFLSAIVVAKGDAAPTPEDVLDPKPLSAPQLEGLRNAAAIGKQIESRMNLIAKKGSRG